MVRKIEWASDALDDLFEIKEYIARTSPANAESVVRDIQRAAAGLVTFPNGHRAVPELIGSERRETFVHRWRLMYRVLPDRIRIVGVIHGSRLLAHFEGRSFEHPAQAEYVLS